MRIINTAKDNPAILDVMGRLAFYSGMDNLTLFEIRDGLADLMDENRWATYNFEMELQAALLEMSFNGIPVDQSARNEMRREFTAIVLDLSSYLNEMLEAIGYFSYYTRMGVHEFSILSGLPLEILPRSWDEWKERPVAWRREVKLAAGEEHLKVYHKVLKAATAPFNPNSSTQKLRLFYHFFGIDSNSIAEPYFYTPHWLRTYGIKEYKSRKTDGTYGPSTNREALEKIIGAFSKGPKYAAHFATPFALVCLNIADLTKSLGFLNCRLDGGMFRSSFGAVTETGRLNSSANAMGYGCFPPGAEVLTPDGWFPIEQVEEGTVIMQAGLTGKFSWANADPYKEFYDGNLLNVDTEQTAFTVTAQHRLPLSGTKPGDIYKCRTAKELASITSKQLLRIGGINMEGTLIYPRLLVALFADGSLECEQTGYWRAGFKKHRKIVRFLQLCKEADIIPTEVSAPEGYRRFSLNVPLDWPIDWGVWILRLSAPTARLFLKECGYWDGTPRGNSIRFYTAKQGRAKWVQTLAHISGMSSTIRKQEQSPGSWSDTLMYIVNIKPKDYAGIEHKHKSLIDYKGWVYCVTVPTSYFLVRQSGKIFVSGNSNGQNVTPKLRHVLSTPTGWKLSAPDYGQVESRIVAAICYRLFGLKNYIAGTECGDLHSLAASMVWDDLPWPEDFTIQYAIKHGAFPKDMLKAAKKIASVEFYRGKSRRDVSKTLGHGTSYLGKPPQMSKHSHIDVGLIVHYQSVFFEMLPEVAMWHGWVAEQVQTKGEITTMLGRARRFFGRPNDDATLREAVAYEPQSVAADYTNAALLRMLKAYLYGVDAVRDDLTPEALNVFESKFPKSLPIKIFLQKHDELGYRYEQPYEEDVNLIVTSLMEKHIPITSPEGLTRDWFVPVEMESGWNLGFRSKKNPNGVGHPDSTLVRTQPKHWKEWKL